MLCCSTPGSEPDMTSSPLRFELPAKLPPGLTRVRDYWESLKRGENDMPFWDDVKLSSLPDLSDCLMLIDAFENPQRFRLNSVAAQIRRSYGADLADKFVDEIAQKGPFELLARAGERHRQEQGPDLVRRASLGAEAATTTTPACCCRCGRGARRHTAGRHRGIGVRSPAGFPVTTARRARFSRSRRSSPLRWHGCFHAPRPPRPSWRR
jgi:hypothetical protein